MQPSVSNGVWELVKQRGPVAGRDTVCSLSIPEGDVTLSTPLPTEMVGSRHEMELQCAPKGLHSISSTHVEGAVASDTVCCEGP